MQCILRKQIPNKCFSNVKEMWLKDYKKLFLRNGNFQIGVGKFSTTFHNNIIFPFIYKKNYIFTKI